MTDSKTPASFGAWVRTRRRQLDLTQAELGKRAGCSEAAIRKIEADERKPSRQLAELLAAALEIPTAEKETFLHFARGILVENIRPTTRPRPNNLPALLTSTVNRVRDLANVSALLKDRHVHLVTLIGPPGIGKTRLSIHCGNDALADFPDGVWFVDLADVTRADFFIPAIARLLPDLDLPPNPSLSQLLNRLKDKRLLLILDNVEQIAEGVALDVAQMLKLCPSLKILVTSRVPLHIYGENEYPLPPLSVPPRDAEKTQDVLMQFEAVQLFVARTRQHQPKFSITPGNAEAVIEICNILDGIPLALELAAATLRQTSIVEMSSLLKNQGWVKRLATPARDLPQRQRTLENVIDWSRTLLAEGQKKFFDNLGVFSGWFDADAAQTLCEASPQITARNLNALTDHSLLVREEVEGVVQWRMLEIIREYALSQLDDKERQRLQHLHADYFLDRMRSGSNEGYFRVNVANLHSALEWMIREKRTEPGFELVSRLEPFWSSLGYFREGLGFTRRLLELPAAANPLTRATRYEAASDLAWQQHDFETGMEYARAAVEIGRTHGLREKYPWFLNRLGRIYIEQEKFADAKEVLAECLKLAEAEPAVINPGSPLAQLGEVALFENRVGEAKSWLERALAYLSAQDGIFLAIAKTDLAEVALSDGNLERARQWIREVFPLASRHARRFIAVLCTLAETLFQTSHYQASAMFYIAVQSLGEQTGIRLGSFYMDRIRQRLGMMRETLSDKDWRKANELGVSLSRDEILKEAEKYL